MTTIAFDGKVLAADRRICGATKIISDEFCKLNIIQGPTGFAVIAAAGHVQEIEAVRSYIEAMLKRELGEELLPTKPALHLEDFAAVTVVSHRNGTIDAFKFDMLLNMLPITPPYTEGSGWAEALAALYCGCGSVQAVGIAKRIDITTGGGTDFVNLMEPNPKIYNVN